MSYLKSLSGLEYELMAAAVKAASEGANEARCLFRNSLKIIVKPDGTRKTNIDDAVDKVIKDSLSFAFPEYGILSEESGQSGSEETRWIVDPIDDTECLISGIPGWHIIIGLQRDGQMELGLSFDPLTCRSAMAFRGHGAWFHKSPPTLSNTNRLEESNIGIIGLKRLLEKRPAGTARLISSCRKIYAESTFDMLTLFLTGRLDAIVAGGGAFWDFAPLSIVTDEAGGCFTDLDGRDSFDSHHGLFSNHRLHSQILNALIE